MKKGGDCGSYEAGGYYQSNWVKMYMPLQGQLDMCNEIMETAQLPYMAQSEWAGRTLGAPSNLSRPGNNSSHCISSYSIMF